MAKSEGSPLTKEAVAPPPPLPEAQTVVVHGKCVIEYVEIGPTEKPAAGAVVPTIVFIHGAPGAMSDFRYIMPLLNANARVIAANMPGFGASNAVEKKDYFTYLDATTATKTMLKALQIICKDDAHVFIIGHSFGGHTAIQIAKLAQEEKLPNIKGLGLMASVSKRPHRTLWPRLMYGQATVMRAEIPLISWAMAEWSRWLMTTFVGFPRSLPTSFFIGGIMRQATTDYDFVMQHLRALDQFPSFQAWAKNDVHIEEELSLALSDIGGPGPRLAFERGGHNIQKTRAPVIAQELLKWISDVVEGRAGSYTDKTPRELE